MSAQQYLSYTYLIGWTEHDTWYYGVRTANKHEPEKDLWVHYFTSSKQVTKFRELHDEPDVIRIDETFDDKEKAIEFEVQKLNEFDVLNESKWLNRSIGGLIGPGILGEKLSESHKRKIGESNKGRISPTKGKKLPPRSLEHSERISKALKGRKCKPFSDEHKKKISEARTGIPRPEITKRKMSISKKGKPAWNKGRPHSEECKQKISEANKGRTGGNRNAGKKRYYNPLTGERKLFFDPPKNWIAGWPTL